MTTADQRELVAALLSVDGVADAAVEESDDQGPGGGPGSLRLLLRPGADEVGVATAVNRVLRDRFGLAVDSDRVAVVEEPAEPDPVPAKGAAKAAAAKVSAQRGKPGASAAGAGAITAAAVVAEAEARLERESGGAAQAATAAAPASRPAAAKPDLAAAGASTVEVAGAELPKTADAPRAAGSTRRPTIERVEVVTAGLNVSSAVTLGLGARSETGRADGMASAAGVHRTVATATLSAVEELVEGSARFQLEHVEIASAAGERTALALVTMLTERGGEQLSGSSVVREDQRQAVIRAVLAAVNRRVEPLLG